MSYSESFEAGLSKFLDGQFLGAVEIDTHALNTHEEMNALAEVWCKAGLQLRENATKVDNFPGWPCLIVLSGPHSC